MSLKSFRKRQVGDHILQNVYNFLRFKLIFLNKIIMVWIFPISFKNEYLLKFAFHSDNRGNTCSTNLIF